MARAPRIPGLSYIPMEEENEGDLITFINFELEEFTLLASLLFRNNRRITELLKIETISEGQFGIVYKVKDTADDQIYALKKFVMPQYDQNDPEPMAQEFLRQMCMLKVVKHLNIVNLKEVLVEESIDCNSIDCNYLLLDYCEYSLENVIRKVDMVFFLHQHIKNIMLQMLSGLQHLHKFNILHRDLCPKNILFTETGILKISDFSSSRTRSNGYMTPTRGLRWYRAPELAFGSKEYTEAVDIWAVGCIFGEMIRLKPLIRGISDGDIVKSIIDLLGSPSEKHWPGFSDLPVPRLYHLHKQPHNRIKAVFKNQTLPTVNYLQRFLKYNPATRPSAEALMQDPYYTEHPHSCYNEALILPLQLSKKS